MAVGQILYVGTTFIQLELIICMPKSKLYVFITMKDKWSELFLKSYEFELSCLQFFSFITGWWGQNQLEMLKTGMRRVKRVVTDPVIITLTKNDPETSLIIRLRRQKADAFRETRTGLAGLNVLSNQRTRTHATLLRIMKTHIWGGGPVLPNLNVKICQFKIDWLFS